MKHLTAQLMGLCALLIMLFVVPWILHHQPKQPLPTPPLVTIEGHVLTLTWGNYTFVTNFYIPKN